MTWKRFAYLLCAVDESFFRDPLHDHQAQRLSYVNEKLAAASAFEALEEGSPSTPHVGGAIVQELLLEESSRRVRARCHGWASTRLNLL